MLLEDLRMHYFTLFSEQPYEIFNYFNYYSHQEEEKETDMLGTIWKVTQLQLVVEATQSPVSPAIIPELRHCNCILWVCS